MSLNPPPLNPEDDREIQEVLNRELSRPCENFQGKPLYPYTPGSKGLFRMVSSKDDPISYQILAFVFIHIRREEQGKLSLEDVMEIDLARHVVPMVWGNLDAFRTHITVTFRNTLSEDDLSEALKITAKELNLEKLSEILSAPPEMPHGARPQKKSGATRRRPRSKKPPKRRKK